MSSNASIAVRFADRLSDAISIEQLQRRSVEGLEQLIERCVGRAVYLMDPRTGGPESVVASGVSEYFVSRYEELGRDGDPVHRRAMDTRSVTSNDGLMAPDDWRSLPLYRDVFALHDVMHVVHAPVVAGDDVVGMFALGRRVGAGRFSDTELALLEAMARMLGVAVSAARDRVVAQRRAQRLEVAVELGDEPVVITDLRLADRTTNAAARRLLADIAGLEGGPEEALAIPAAAGEEELREMPVQLRGGGHGVLRVRSVRAADPSLVVSFLRLQRPRGTSRGGALAALTAREREVAELVSFGLRDAEVASRLFLSPHTVTKYLTGIYRKLGVRSRVELARVVFSGQVEDYGNP